MKCPSIHKWSDLRCTLESGHGGYCCSKAMRNPANGTFTRVWWFSKNGVFKSHYWYETKYPINAKRNTPAR